ncbi:MAG: magnesium-translocating P-type ATPase [Croceibacterium sp.]
MTAQWAMDGKAALASLDSGAEGLSGAQATARLAKYGPNRIAEGEERSWPALLRRQFLSPLALILIFGAAISLGLGDWLDASIILAILAGSGLLSFAQEYRASQAVAALRAQLALRVKVRRKGAEAVVPADSIVPGDVVLLSAGNLVPADGVVLEARDCQVTEAALTGESMPVEKTPGVLPEATPMGQRTNMLFMGSSVRSGTATMLITETGRSTEFGGIAGQLRQAETETEFARGIRHFGGMLLKVMIVIVVAVLAVNQLLGRPIAESLLFAVALAVGLSPEMLPAIISVTLAAGARHLAAGGVIVRRLDAIENLGSMDVLCTDKTGTLTEGVVRLDAALGCLGEPSDDVARAAFLNASLETGIANPLDAAITAAGAERKLTVGKVRKLDEIPYDFLRRRLTIVVAEAGTKTARMITKGAFAEVLAVCSSLRRGEKDVPLDDAARAALEAMVRDKGTAGFRALAVAERRMAPQPKYRREDEVKMTFLGLLLFLDPPKEGAAGVLGELRAKGIAVKMITGDNRYVAAHVAHTVGMDVKHLLTGGKVAELSSDALRRRVTQVSVFAEIDPQQKERIIHALQQAGHAVGYMGDGINDAPALHLADVGISVDTAVDVARESADIVLLKKDLAVLQQGVIDGRHTFANTLKYIYIAVSSNFGNMVSMALATPLLPFLPLLAKQILLNNFMADLPSVAISTDSVDPEHIAEPQRWNVHDVRRFMIGFGLLSSIFDMVSFALLIFVFRAGAELFHTAWFEISLLTEFAALFALRTRRFALASRPSQLLLWSAVGTAAVALALPYFAWSREAFGLVPLRPALLVATLAIMLTYAAALELAKRVLYRTRRRAGRTTH